MKLNFSIIIPTVNKRPEKLLRAIHSVMNQKKGNIIDQTEILISNNASQALEGEVVVEQQKGLLQVIDSSAVRGVSFARNQGVAAAQHDIISFLDDDDWWCETFLLELGQALVEKNVDLVSCGYWIWNSELIKRPGFQPTNSPTEENFFLSTPLIGGSSIIIRKDVFTKLGGFDEKFFTTEDKEFFLRFMKGNYAFCAFQGCLVNVDRTTTESLCTAPSRDRVMSQKYFYERYASEMSPEIRRRYLAKIEFGEAASNGSLRGLIKPFFVYPALQGDIIRLLKVQIPDRWPRLYEVGMWGRGWAKGLGLWKFVSFTWKCIVAVIRRF